MKFEKSQQLATAEHKAQSHWSFFPVVFLLLKKGVLKWHANTSAIIQNVGNWCKHHRRGQNRNEPKQNQDHFPNDINHVHKRDRFVKHAAVDIVALSMGLAFLPASVLSLKVLWAKVIVVLVVTVVVVVCWSSRIVPVHHQALLVTIIVGKRWSTSASMISSKILL